MPFPSEQAALTPLAPLLRRYEVASVKEESITGRIIPVAPGALSIVTLKKADVNRAASARRAIP